MTNHRHWLPPMNQDIALMEQVLATPQAHLVDLAKKVTDLEMMHDLSHVMGLNEPDRCRRIVQAMGEMEADIDRGLRATWN